MSIADPETVVDLPDHVAIMVVDTREFSKHNDIQQDRLAPMIPELLRRAADRAGLAELWEHRAFPDSTGDGFMLGFPPRLLPSVVHRYLDTLQGQLRDEQRSLRADKMRLRMRLSLNLGPVGMVDDPSLDSPVGSAMIATHRLVDAEPVRVLLERSNPDVTLLAAALSESVMDAVVRTGHSGRHPDEFVAAPVRIAAKDFTGTAYLRVPAPSGDLLAHGLLGVQPTEPEPTETPDTPPTRQPEAASTADHGGRVSRIGDLGDGSVATGDVTGNIGVLGPLSGHGNTVTGGDVNHSTNTINAGRDGYQAQHDVNVDRRDPGPRAAR